MNKISPLKHTGLSCSPTQLVQLDSDCSSYIALVYLLPSSSGPSLCAPGGQDLYSFNMDFLSFSLLMSLLLAFLWNRCLLCQRHQMSHHPTIVRTAGFGVLHLAAMRGDCRQILLNSAISSQGQEEKQLNYRQVIFLFSHERQILMLLRAVKFKISILVSLDFVPN